MDEGDEYMPLGVGARLQSIDIRRDRMANHRSDQPVAFLEHGAKKCSRMSFCERRT